MLYRYFFQIRSCISNTTKSVPRLRMTLFLPKLQQLVFWIVCLLLLFVVICSNDEDNKDIVYRLIFYLPVLFTISRYAVEGLKSKIVDWVDIETYARKKKWEGSFTVPAAARATSSDGMDERGMEMIVYN
jgi:hypothetical protein